MGKNSGSSLFLMELILAILIFSLASTVCVRLFVSSYLISEDSLDLNRSILWSQNIAEAFLSSDGTISVISDVYPDDAEIEGDTAYVYFDNNWNPCAIADAAAYCVSLSLDEKVGELQMATVISRRLNPSESQAEVIYTIPLSKCVK